MAATVAAANGDNGGGDGGSGGDDGDGSILSMTRVALVWDTDSSLSGKVSRLFQRRLARVGGRGQIQR